MEEDGSGRTALVLILRVTVNVQQRRKRRFLSLFTPSATVFSRNPVRLLLDIVTISI